MKTTFKYRLPFMEEAEVVMPVGAEIIRIDGLDGALWIWAIIDTEAEEEKRTFHLFKTGAAMPDDIVDNYKYLGCGAIFIQQELMLYVFEKRESEAKELQDDGWIYCDGVDPELAAGTQVVVKFRCGVEEGYAGDGERYYQNFEWGHFRNGCGGYEIVQYKVVK